MAKFGICFGIDESRIRPLKDPRLKTQAFSTLLPGVRSTYTFNKSESQYYDQYEESFYGFTKKKGGWDCLRHYEILAAGALPYFVDLKDAPAQALQDFPRELVLAAMQLPGVSPEGHIDMAVFPIDTYDDIRRKLRTYMLNHLTLRAVATRVLGLVGNPKTVLYLSGNGRPDLMRCSLLAGLKVVLGPYAVVDYTKVAHIYKSFEGVIRGYGNGYTYSRILDHDPELDRSDEAISTGIRSHAWDVVVFGSIHRGMPFLEEVRKAYAPAEIVYVCGADSHACRPCGNPGSVFFIRELQCLRT